MAFSLTAYKNVCYKKPGEYKKKINAKEPKFYQWKHTEIVIENYQHDGKATQIVKCGIVNCRCIILSIKHKRD